MLTKQLDEFFDYKNQLMHDLLSSKGVVELINEHVDIENAKSLAYRQVFPLEYVPETVEEGKTFICFDVDIQESTNKTYLLSTLYIWIFSHRSKLRLPNGEGVLTDELCSRIAGLINGSRNYGLGELNLHSVKRFAPMTDYQGKLMTFYAKDFNRQHNANKAIPSNRKRG